MKRFLLPLGIIIIAVAITVLLIVNRPEPEQQSTALQGALVRVRTVHRRPEQLTVAAAGTVRPARSVRLHPQVPGRLIWVSEKLVPGAIIEEGEHLVTIEQDDYLLAVAERNTDLVEARANLALEKGRQEVAEDEWDRFAVQLESSEKDKSLATREPQLHIAEARVKRAVSLLEQAKLNLERTELRAPFQAVIAEENVEVGQLVNSQSLIARLLATDSFWVETAIPVEFVPVIDIPGINADRGAGVAISYDYQSERLELTGRVFRLLPEIDPAGRMARLLVRVDDPYQLGLGDAREKNNALPLLVGSYVDLEIKGPTGDDLIEIPRTALHEGYEVYVMSPQQTLEIREVTPLWERRDTILIQTGLEDGDRVIVSRIAAPFEGMALRLDKEDPGKKEEPRDE